MKVKMVAFFTRVFVFSIPLQAFTACAVDIMPHTQVFLDKSGYCAENGAVSK